MNIENLFENKTVQAYKVKRNYDVRITLNKSGDGRFMIRFGFLNDAAKAFKGGKYVQISRVEVCQDKIYFRVFEEKKYLDAYKLGTNTNSNTSNLYTAFMPTTAAEKIYRAKWVGKTFKIKYDAENELYFIGQEGEMA